MNAVICSSLVYCYDSELFGNFIEYDAQNYLTLIVKIQKSECHLDNEILVSTNDVARNKDFRGEEFAQKIVIGGSRRAIIHLFLPFCSFNMQ